MVKIFADSTCDLTQEKAKELGVTLIPLTINVDGKSYRDGIDITKKDFYELLKTSKTLPTTSQANPNTFEEYYRPVIEAGDDIVVITLASKLSATYQSANIAASEFDEGRIFVVDSKSVSIGIEILVRYAVRLAKDTELSAKEIYEKVQSTAEKTRVYAAISTLDYLVKGGRLNPQLAIIGGILNLFPIVEVRDGEIKPMKKVRGHNAAMKALKDIIECNDIDYSFDFEFGNADAEDKEKMYLDYIGDSIENKECIIHNELGSVIATHSGPGVIGMAFVIK